MRARLLQYSASPRRDKRRYFAQRHTYPLNSPQAIPTTSPIKMAKTIFVPPAINPVATKRTYQGIDASYREDQYRLSAHNVIPTARIRLMEHCLCDADNIISAKERGRHNAKPHNTQRNEPYDRTVDGYLSLKSLCHLSFIFPLLQIITLECQLHHSMLAQNVFSVPRIFCLPFITITRSLIPIISGRSDEIMMIPTPFFAMPAIIL